MARGDSGSGRIPGESRVIGKWSWGIAANFDVLGGKNTLVNDAKSDMFGREK